MKKKTLSAFLCIAAVIVCFVCLQSPASAAETEGYYAYEVTNGEATITDVDTAISGNITIPSTLGGYPVVSIGKRAFSKCISITAVTIPDGVTTIAYGAFENCSGLNSITIPDSVTSIDGYAFSGCASLTYQVYCNAKYLGNENNPYHALIRDASDSVTSYMIHPRTVIIASTAFSYCSKLTDITIPNNVTHIGERAFYFCTSLLSIELSDNLTSVGDSAFGGCSNLTGITIPDSVTHIGQYAFDGCSSLTNIIIPKNVIRVGTYAFRSCSKLTNVTINGGEFDSYAFAGCRNLTVVTLNGGALGNYVFFSCTNLTQVTIGSHVTSIKDFAFSGCSNLTAVYILDLKAWCSIIFDDTYANPLECGKNLYLRSNLIKDLVIPNGIEKISTYAFSGCSSLTSITLPNSVTSIDKGAFSDCKSLITIKFKGDAPSIGIDCFDNIAATAYYPAGNSTWTTSKMKDYGGTITWVPYENNCQHNYESIVTPPTVTEQGFTAHCCTVCGDSYVDNCTEALASYFTYTVLDGKASITSVNTAISGNITIPSTLEGYPVTRIDKSAFYNCNRLKSVTFSNSVTVIDEYAFQDCSSLTSITIPDSVLYIGAGAFSGCSSLESMTIPFVGYNKKTSTDFPQMPFGFLFGTSDYAGSTATTQVYYVNNTHREQNTYYIPNSLKSITVTGGEILYGAFSYCNNLTSVTIGDNVTNINERAFYKCNHLTNVTIGDGVSGIGISAFCECNSLASITGGAGVIKICEFAFAGCSSLTNLAIGNNVASIDYGAFTGCTSLPQIVIPGNVDSIGDYAFSGCENLKSLTICDGVTSIGNSSFAWCSNLTDAIIPDSVTEIKTSVFTGCYKLESITIPFVGNTKKTASDTEQYPLGYMLSYFYFTGGFPIEQYYYGSSISYTTSDTYYFPPALKKVAVTGGELLYGAFYNCSMLTDIIISENVTRIDGYAFYGCTGLKNLTIGGESIDAGSKYSIHLKKSSGDAVLTIDDYAFSTCSDLETITFRGDAPVFGGNNIFKKSVTIYYPVNNPTWTKNIMQDYGGNITWVSYVPECEHDYESIVTPPTTTTQGYTTHTCTVCGDSYVDNYTDPVKPAAPSMNLRFASAYLSLQSDLSVIFQVKSEVLAEYDDVTLTFKVGQNGQEQVFSEEEYFIGQSSRPSYKVTGVAPRQVSETIYATLHGYYDGVEYSYTMEYSASNYCYSTLRKSTTAAKLKTLIVDLLNYAAAHQVYGSTNLDNMANANLTDAEKALGTATVPAMVSYQNAKYVTHAAPTARFKNASLYLESAVTIRCLLNLNAGVDINKVTVKITDDAGNTWTVPGAELEDAGSNNYYLNFKGLSAQQMRKVIYLTICENGKAISHTLRYSIETYAASKYACAATNLKNLILTMIRYGDAAKAYFESK